MPISEVVVGTAHERARLVADEVAAQWADQVDVEARFPAEAVAAMRKQRLLSVAVPTEFGGEGLSLREVAEIARILGSRCAASGMIFAMHQTQIYSLVKHGNTEALRAFVVEVTANQLLLASATTELGIGGDVSRSYCAVEDLGGHLLLIKNAPVISYGEEADAIVVTARRTPESQPNDQVLVVCRRADLTLEKTTDWNTLGLRGTCSLGYILRATSTPDMVAKTPYSYISTNTMLPVSHVVWSSVWLGIADAALEKARKYVRAAARKQPGVSSPGALRLAETAAVAQQFADLVDSSARRYDLAAQTRDGSEELATTDSVGFALSMNNLKVTTSNSVVEIIGQAMLICGISGYREDSEYSLGRHLRDAHGAALMVNNDRIMAGSAQMAIGYRGTL
ncbi:acyl-CoA dehydrogenase family protein [Rhodococcus sp. ARC_M6]|uniref:acyl-CoA dehydrogenase family protein n=1 Tax=Rhodococcus sp. ARC_M6 TaxID=2928852 RepID=UPI001FB28531|nr:acyl-CoA dehydrogenase family protein [Rhodococcus sp. ARC_M6]MCJ0904078.1 acyl-CoA/acyl-ACP dehydrogenase [Rhodococcus sp. ARC_M6]